MTKLNIGIFTETYRPTVNGVVVSVDAFKSVLESKGHTYYIFAPMNQKAKDDPENVFRFPAMHFPNDPIYPLALPMPFSWALNQFPLEIIQELDVIHIQHFSMMGQYGWRLAKMYNIPVVYTYHTMAELYAHNFPILGSLAIPILTMITRFTASKVDQVIVPTPSIKAYVRKLGVTAPITVVPTGIITGKYKRVNAGYAHAKYDIPDNQAILLFVGRLAAEKNILFMLESFIKVLKRQPHTHLLVVGSGPDKDKYQRWISQRNLGKHITITGFLERKETIKLFGTADLFVFPSTTDTQGIVIIEAMAAGTPPVAIDRLGPHDLIDNNKTGLLVPLNQEVFSDTIINLLDDPKKRKQLSTAAMSAAKHYDVAVTARMMEKVYIQAVNKRK